MEARLYARSMWAMNSVDFVPCAISVWQKPSESQACLTMRFEKEQSSMWRDGVLD